MQKIRGVISKEIELSEPDKKSVDEAISAICREISEGDISGCRSRSRTLKSYVQNINSKITRYLAEQDQSKEKEQHNVNWALGILSFVAIALLMNSNQSNPDFDWIRESQLGLKLWGVALAAIYIGASIERSNFFQSLWKFSATKVVLSISFSGLVLYSTGKAAGAINSIFGVDAAAFPVTYAFTTAILVFNMVAPFLFFISLGAILHIFNAAGWIRSKWNGKTYELPPYHSFVFPVLASVIMYYGWAWSNNELGEDALPTKIYIIARSLDFNSKHECSNLEPGFPVVFLGAAQSSVLADKHKMEGIDFGLFFNSRVDVPDRLFRMECSHHRYDR